MMYIFKFPYLSYKFIFPTSNCCRFSFGKGSKFPKEIVTNFIGLSQAGTLFSAYPASCSEIKLKVFNDNTIFNIISHIYDKS